jgi:hypothetical protein
MKRPLSLTIIAWLMIASGSLGLGNTLYTLANPFGLQMLAGGPLLLRITLASSAVAALVSFVCGIGVLRAQNWARLLQLGWAVIMLLVVFAVSPYPAAILPGVVIVLFFNFLLFRRRADDWFGKYYLSKASDDAGV